MDDGHACLWPESAIRPPGIVAELGKEQLCGPDLPFLIGRGGWDRGWHGRCGWPRCRRSGGRDLLPCWRPWLRAVRVIAQIAADIAARVAWAGVPAVAAGPVRLGEAERQQHQSAGHNEVRSAHELASRPWPGLKPPGRQAGVPGPDWWRSLRQVDCPEHHHAWDASLRRHQFFVYFHEHRAGGPDRNRTDVWGFAGLARPVLGNA